MTIKPGYDSTLNLRDAVALQTVLRAAQTNARVQWLNPDSGALMDGVARHLVRDTVNAYFLTDDDDVRGAYLRISSTFEYFLPVVDVIAMVQRGEFAIDDNKEQH